MAEPWSAAKAEGRLGLGEAAGQRGRSQGEARLLAAMSVGVGSGTDAFAAPEREAAKD